MEGRDRGLWVDGHRDCRCKGGAVPVSLLGDGGECSSEDGGVGSKGQGREDARGPDH